MSYIFLPTKKKFKDFIYLFIYLREREKECVCMTKRRGVEGEGEHFKKTVHWVQSLTWASSHDLSRNQVSDVTQVPPKNHLNVSVRPFPMMRTLINDFSASISGGAPGLLVESLQNTQFSPQN